MWGITDFLAQGTRPGIGLTHLWSRIALGGRQHWAQGELQDEFLLRTRGGGGQQREQREPRSKVGEGFHIR